VNTQIFHDFLNKLNFSEQTSYLLMDNVSFHRASGKRKELGLPSIEEQLAEKNMVPNYLPPYTPMLNPAELIINVVRHNIEKSRS